ncbi:cytochrome P450 52A11 [Bimuria novae-zelandiae CBS 107.79]|uniref:Cytochrome P450 52A11 n=1 Tax=Bimuria novae-zelandiae CBS 107.79 TaxID=1447943 RepID=A0A6A5V3E5_9PLEO|nr:cytochrome P450 52A11 [Bimuria novae-zelandiae CBS 107.79]
MATNVYAILAIVPIAAYFVYLQLYSWRFRKYKDYPQLPNSLFMGHLPHIASGFKKFGDARRHIDYIFQSMVEEAGRPDVLLVDVRPVSYAMAVISSHAIAEQISKVSKGFPTSVTKSPTFSAFTRLVGHESVLIKEGDAWKSLRKRFNPGFAPQHLSTLLPAIVEKSTVFMEKLDSFAKSGEEFALEPLCTNVTFDIIGAVIMNLDFEAQDLETGGHPVVYHTRKLLRTFANSGRPGLIPWWTNVPLVTSRIYHSNRADAAIKKCITEKFGEMNSSPSAGKKQGQDRSVLALALKDVGRLSSDVLQSTADQIKTFLFAGHDTTSILLQWVYYALSIHPKCLETIRAEHDAVFGDKDPREVYLAKPDETTKALSYTSACIKEALRLWPPAGTARMAPLGSGFRVRLEDGRDLCIDGTVIYINHFIIQRDPKVYGETANEFVPERWLGDTDTTSARADDVWDSKKAGDNKIPISAWRPFERGPRSCIGQELANLEARVILACTVRRYDFSKVGAGEVELNENGQPTLDDRGRYRLKSELFSAPVITAKPFDRCMMRVQLHDSDARHP